jgi:hypothetical protein
MGNPGEHSRTRSNAEIPATSYQLLYEFERRLDDKMREARDQTKEDIKAAITVAVAPIFPRLDNIDQRLDEGNQKFAAQDARASDHSDRIEDAMALVKAHKEKCPVRKPVTDAFEAKPKKSMPWWLPLLIGGALAFLGERVARVAINALADPPSSSQANKP